MFAVLAIALSWSAVPAQAIPATAPLVIDDFSTGPYTSTAVGLTVRDTQYQGGATILGGARSTHFAMGDNPRNTPATLDLGSPNHFNLTLGARQSFHFELGYGYSPSGAQVPLDLNLNDKTAIVISFQEVLAPDQSYFPGLAILAYSGRSYSDWGENIVVPGNDPFQVSIPLSAFRHNDGTDWSNVALIAFIFTARSTLAIDRIELV